MNAPGSTRSAPGEKDWTAASLPELLDHLVRDHERILTSLVPEIEAALGRAMARKDPSPRVESLASAWPAFSQNLAAHMKEEESFLYPRILHYDYCVTHGDLHPDFVGGSVNVFIALHLMGNETRQMEALERLLEDANPGNPDALDPALDRALGIFRERMLRHSRLETDVLFPRARALEKSLYDTAISGKR